MNLNRRIELRDPGCRDARESQSTAGCAALFIIGAVICFAVSWYLNS